MLAGKGINEKEMVYGLTGAVKYDSGFEGKHYCGYFAFKNKWHSVNIHGIKEVDASDLTNQSFFLFFYSHIRDSPQKTTRFMRENEQLTANWGSSSFYYTTLSCLLLTNSFLQLCFQSKDSSLKDLSSAIAELMESERVQQDPAFLFEKIWEHFYKFEKDLITPNDFLHRLIEKIDPKLAEEYFEVRLEKVKVWKTATKVISWPHWSVGKTLRLPIPGLTDEREEEVWYALDEFHNSRVNLFYAEATEQGLQQFAEALRQVESQKLKLKPDRNLTVAKCLKHKVRTIGKEEEVKLTTPKNTKSKQVYEQRFLRRIGAIVIVEFFYENSPSKKISGNNIRIDSILDLREFLPSAQNYELRAIIKRFGNLYTAYIEIGGLWYTLINSDVRLIEQLPATMTDLQVLIYEISGRTGNSEDRQKVPIISSGECGKVSKILRYKLKGIRVMKMLLSMSGFFQRWKVTIEHKALSFWSDQTAELKKLAIQKQKEKLFLESADYQRPKQGIPNLANSCFMNVVLNCLFYTNSFLSLFMNRASFMRSNLAFSLSQFCNLYQQRSTDMVMETVLRSVLRELQFSEVNESCPHLFLTSLLSKLQAQEFSRTQELRNVVSVSEYQIFTCTRCHLSRFYPTLNWTLVLYPLVKDQRNVDELLQEKYFPTTESSVYCGECGSPSTHLSCHFVYAVSPVLVLFLDHSASSRSGDIRIKYEQELDFNKYLPVSCRYRLHAVINLLYGLRNHVIAYIKLAENWYSFDDEQVKAVSQSEISNSSAYMLLYERVRDSAMETSMSLKGLPNLGNTCFMNSMITALFYISRLRDFLTEPNKHQIADFALQFSSFMREPQIDLLGALLRHFPEFRDGEQHCTHSFLLSILGKLDADLHCENEFKDSTAPFAWKLKAYQLDKCLEMHKMFSLLSESVLVCSNCFRLNRSRPFDYARTLVLPIPLEFLQVANATVFSATDYYASDIYSKCASSSDANLQKYVSALHTFETVRKQFPNIVPGVSHVDLTTCIRFAHRAHLMDESLPCANCGRDTKHFKQRFMRHVGSVLVIQLGRYMEGEYVSMPVRFPYLLDLKDFLNYSKTFQLKVIVNHFGASLHEGHYTSYVNLKGSWYSFDDLKVEPVSAGPGLFQHAYLLIYEKT